MSYTCDFRLIVDETFVSTWRAGYRGGMEHTDQIAAGAWIAQRVDASYDTMHGVMPRGFEAYARALHSPTVASLPGERLPTADEVVRMSDAARHELSERTVVSDSTWAEAARAFGTTLHPLAQWNALVRAGGTDPDPNDWMQTLAPDGREFSAPDEGSTSPQVTAAIVTALTGTDTATPIPGFAAVWNGHGGLLGGHGGIGRAFFTMSEATSPDTDAEVAQRHRAMLNASLHDPFNNVFRQPAWVDGILSRAISEGPMLELPGREHVMFSGDVSLFRSPDWVLDVPWRDRPAEQHGFDPAAATPSLIWPADHAWIIAAEVDFDSTLVGGSRAAVDRLLGAEGLEVFEIPAEADLTWGGDQINL